VNQQPTKEAWQALYKVAIELKLLKPWNFLNGMDIISIILPRRKEPVFCSIMGALGECYAIGVFDGYTAVSDLKKMTDSDDIPMNITASYQNCLMCYFSDREELVSEDMQTLKDLGLKFRGRNDWIYFRAHNTGFAPWFIDSKQCELMTQTLQGLVMAILVLQDGMKVDFEKGETLVREYSEKRGEWINYAAKLQLATEHFSEVTIGNELLLKKLSNFKKNEVILELELCYLLTPIQERKSQRPYLPQMIMFADANAGTIQKYKMLSKKDKAIQILFDMLAEYIESYGKPSIIYVRDKRIRAIVDDFCSKVGIDLEERRRLPVIDEYLDYFSTVM
jgi:hypothetical protein